STQGSRASARSSSGRSSSDSRKRFLAQALHQHSGSEVPMQEIGRIKLVQIQCSSLKQGQRPYCYYDPTPLLVVERLLLAPRGAVGLTASGQQLTDVHHADHPESKNHGLLNGTSIGFTSHYRRMRDQFGAHLADGCAGENILIE